MKINIGDKVFFAIREGKIKFDPITRKTTHIEGKEIDRISGTVCVTPADYGGYPVRPERYIRGDDGYIYTYNLWNRFSKRITKGWRKL